jgi:hypothetical protein
MKHDAEDEIGAGGFSRRRLAYVALFSLAMAYFESSVVVYLRAIAYPEGFAFPLAGIDPFIAATEVGREAASLLMILTVAIIAGRSRPQRFACFLLIFGIWDIFYYLFLQLLLGWPASLGTWDVLFLIPVVWAAPVAAPAGVALLMAGLGLAILRGDRRKRHGGSEAVLPAEAFRHFQFRMLRREMLLIAAGGFLLFTSFVWDYLRFALPRLDGAGAGGGPEEGLFSRLSALGMEYVPEAFPWLLYAGGLLLLAAVIASVLRRS